MKGPPLPLATLPLPLSPGRAGRAGPAHRVPLVLLCQETGTSPPRPARPGPAAAPRARHPRGTPTRDTAARPGPTGRGSRAAPAASPEGTHPSRRARPRPRPPRSRSRRCPRRPRPALSALGEAAGARVPRGGARQTMGQRGRGAACGSADRGLRWPAGRRCARRFRETGSPWLDNGDLSGPAPLRLRENLGQREGRPRLGRGNPGCFGEGTGLAPLERGAAPAWG